MKLKINIENWIKKTFLNIINKKILNYIQI